MSILETGALLMINIVAPEDGNSIAAFDRARAPVAKAVEGYPDACKRTVLGITSSDVDGYWIVSATGQIISRERTVEAVVNAVPALRQMIERHRKDAQ